MTLRNDNAQQAGAGNANQWGTPDVTVGAMPVQWWLGAVIYHIYPRSFQDSDGDGVGDLHGVLSRLDYLAWLGVDAIWLSPFYVSPGVDFGYDVADHCAVDPAMGDLATFDALVADAHRRGIRVIIDFVASFTSRAHPWFQEALQSRKSPRRDWYQWSDQRPGGGPPNNWVAVSGGSAWTWDPTSDQYYLNSFMAGAPDLDWRNPQVESAMLDVLRFWMDRGVDGFRIDMAEHIAKDPLLRDNPPALPVHGGSAKNLGEYDRLRHLHDRGHPDIHPIYRRMRRLLDTHNPEGPRLSMAEIVPEPGVDLQHWASFFGLELDEIHLPMNLTLPALPWRAEGFRDVIEVVEAAIPDGASTASAVGSHDEPRVASRYGPAEARCMLVLLLTLPGTPILYYGDELALPNAPVRHGEERDPWGRRNPAFNRDLGRTPMLWTDDRCSGFTTADEPWLPLPAAPQGGGVAAQRIDDNSVLRLARRLIALRNASPALRFGNFRALALGSDLLAYERIRGQARVVVIINFSSDGQEVPALSEQLRLRVSTSPATHLGGPGVLSIADLSAVVLEA